jgi:hypothetical protein
MSKERMDVKVRANQKDKGLVRLAVNSLKNSKSVANKSMMLKS